MNTRTSVGLSSKDNMFFIHIFDVGTEELIIKIELTTEQFAKFITNHHIKDVNVELSNIHHVGKKKTADFIQINCPYFKNDTDYENYIKEQNLIKEGWEFSHINAIRYAGGDNRIVTVCIKTYEDII